MLQTFTAAALLAEIRCNYSASPVPRDVDSASPGQP